MLRLLPAGRERGAAGERADAGRGPAHRRPTAKLAGLAIPLSSPNLTVMPLRFAVDETKALEALVLVAKAWPGITPFGTSLSRDNLDENGGKST